MDTIYFPSLDRCLIGVQPVIPWSSVLDLLILDTDFTNEIDLRDFLCHEQTIASLAKANAPFDKPTEQSKREFETRTAPIHVSTRKSNEYALEQIKSDALWLSQKLNIDEISALRIVIIEWQSRPVDKFLGRIAIQTVSSKSASKSNNTELDDVVRHRRLLHTFLRERSAIFNVSAILHGVDGTTSEGTVSGAHESWINGLSQKLRASKSGSELSSPRFMLGAFKSNWSYLQDTKNWPECFQTDFALHEVYNTAVLRDMVSAIRIALQSAFNDQSISSNTVLSWFRAIKDAGFLQGLMPANPEQSTLCEILQCLVAVLLGSLLQVSKIVQTLNRAAFGNDNGVTYPQMADKSYIEEISTIRELNVIIFEAAENGSPVAAPAALAWSIITMYIRDAVKFEQEEVRQIEDEQNEMTSARHGSATRRHSDMELKYDSLQDLSLGAARDDPPQHLARMVVDGLNVYGVITNLSRIISASFSNGVEAAISQTSRTVLYDITRESLPTVTYDEHVLEATLSIIAPDDEIVQSTSYSQALIKRFWFDDSRFKPLIWQQAVARYPYELTPIIRLVNTLCASTDNRSADLRSILSAFKNMPSNTLTFPEGFRGYSLEHEEEGVNAFKLSVDLPLFTTNQRSQLAIAARDTATALDDSALQSILFIPTNTPGSILRDSRPFIVSLQHQHSGLYYAGLLLSTLTSNSAYMLAPPASDIDQFTAAEIISLATTLLRQSESKAEVDSILHDLSAALPEDADITTVITELLESSYLQYTEQSKEAGSVDLLTASIKFIEALSVYHPERMWIILSQTSMLDQNTASSANLATYNETDDLTKYHGLLDACIRLYQTSLDDATSGLVKRRKQSDRTKSSKRFDSPMDDAPGMSERNINQVLSRFTRLAVGLLTSLSQSTVLSLESKTTLSSKLIASFEQVLLTAYGVNKPSTSTMGSTFNIPSEIILSSLLPQASHSTSYSPLLLLQNALQVEDPSLSTRQKITLISQAQSILTFTITTLRVLALLERHYKQFVSVLAGQVSLFANLFTLHPLLREPVARLLTEIVVGLDDGKEQSIFSNLSPEQGIAFLRVLVTFDRPLPDVSTECRIWDLFSAACEHGQQLFAMFLLTGALPRDRIQDDKEASNTVFSHALDTLVDLKNVNPERAAAILKFVARAQRVWVWASSLIRSHSEFINSALSWLDELKPHTRNSKDLLLEAREFDMAAYICDILAANAHAGLETGDRTVIKLISQKTGFLAKHGMVAGAYNHALHKMLSENLSKRFTGLKLADLERTSVNPASIGSDYRYDTAFAAELLRHDTSWTGTGRGNGFVDELARANTNLSLVDVQFRLIQEWKALAITLSDSGDDSPELNKLQLETIHSCIEANIATDAVEPHSAALLQLRIDLIFVLLSRLVKVEYKGDSSEKLLQQLWKLIRESPVDYEVAEAQIDLTYYRSLLQCLFLALQLGNISASPSNNTMDLDDDLGSTLIEIVTKTVTKGFRALCSNLHESESYAHPNDFAILTAIMRAILSARSTKSHYSQIADAIAQSGALRSAASLYSWSDRLADITGQDPMYGEVAIVFLVTVSRLPQVAETIALEGILNQLSSANLSNHFRKTGGKGPFDEPVRMFSIWTDGFLPICLNLLEAVGPPVVSEISSFLNSFPEQLKRAETALQNATATSKNPRAGAVTLGLIVEARDLTLLGRILTISIELGAAEGIIESDVQPLQYNVTSVRYDVEALTKSSRSLRDRVMPANARENALFGDKTSGSSDDALQAAITEQITLFMSSND